MSARRRRVSAATVFFAVLSLALAAALFLRSRPSPPPSPARPATPLPRRSPVPPRAPAALPPRPATEPLPGARVAIIIDDLGNDRAAALQLARWREPVACAVLPLLPGSAASAQTLSQSGKEVLLHLPMEPRGFPSVRPGPGLVLLSQTDAEIRATLARDLDSVPHAVGVNNHMGSLATADRRVMQVVAAELARLGLFFVDSRTTDLTIAADAAARARVPSASRRVFLDDVQTAEAVRRSLDDLVSKAKAEGSAIAIGHPHPVTLSVLEQELPHLAERGVRLVRVSELVK